MEPEWHRLRPCANSAVVRSTIQRAVEHAMRNSKTFQGDESIGLETEIRLRRDGWKFDIGYVIEADDNYMNFRGNLFLPTHFVVGKSTEERYLAMSSRLSDTLIQIAEFGLMYDEGWSIRSKSNDPMPIEVWY